MKQTQKQTQTIQVLYELALSIGTSLNLQQMLDVSMPAFAKQLGCVVSTAYRCQMVQDAYHFEAVGTKAQQAGKVDTVQMALAALQLAADEQQIAQFKATLPLVGEGADDDYYHLLDLPGFGVLLLIKDGFPLDEAMLGALRPLQEKLAIAANACLLSEPQPQAEPPMLARETLLRTIIDSTPDWIFVKDREHRYRLVNQGYADSFHMTPEDFIGKNDLEIGFPEEIVKGNLEKGIRGFWADDLEIMQSGKTKVIDIEPAVVDGEPRYLHTIKAPLKDENSEVQAVIGFVHDITKRVNTENSLRESELALSQALDLAKLGYWEFDVAQDLFIFNDQFFALFHTTAEQHGGYQLSSAYYAQNFVYPDDMPLVGSEIEKALTSTDRHYNRLLEHRILYADGGIGYISVNVNVERDEVGNILRFYGANQDITERKVAEEAMRRLAYAVDQSLDGAAVADLDGNVTFVNPAWAKMHGYTVAELIGSHLSIFHSPEQLENEVAPANAHVMKTGESVQAEIGHVRKDGTLFPTLMSIGLLYDANGNPIGLSAACQDITKRKAAELQLRENQERLAESNRISKLYPWEFDLATQMFTFIPEYFEFLGTSVKENGGLLISAQEYATKFVPPEEAAIVAEEIGKAIATEDPNYSRNVETYNLTADGRIIPILVRFRIEKDQDGNTAKIVGANQDISEQRAVEEVLRRNEAEQAEALEMAKLAYWQYDVTQDLFTFNDQFFALFQTTAEQHGGYQLSSAYYAQNFVHPDDVPLVGSEIGQALNTTEPYYHRILEHRILYADGSVGYISVNVNVERDEAGNIFRFYGANQDITQRKQVEERLASQARKFQIVAELSTAVAQNLEPDKLLQEVVDLTKERFDLYHAHIYLLNLHHNELVLANGAGDVGHQLVQQKHAIPLDSVQSLVARAARTGEAVIVNDVRNDANWLPNKLLPETQAEMAIPMKVGGRVIGVLDVQANEIDWFTEQDVQIKTALAAQVSISLENARSFEQAQTAVTELNALTNRLTGEGWKEYFDNNQSNEALRFLFDGNAVKPAENEAAATALQENSDEFLEQPIQVRGVKIGKMALVPEENDDELEEIVSSVISQLSSHIENLRLTEQVQTALAQTEALYTGSERIVLSTTEADILDSLIFSTELRRLDRANIFLFDEPVEDGVPQDVTAVAIWENEGVPRTVEVGTRFTVEQVPFMQMITPERSMVVADVYQDPRIDESTRQILVSYGMVSFVLFPMVVGSQWLGMVSGQSASPLLMNEVQRRQASSLVSQASVVLQTTILFRQEQARARREQLLREIATKVRSSVDVDTVMRTAVTEIGRTLGRRAFIELGNGQPANGQDLNGAT